MLRSSDVTDSARSASQLYRLISEFTVPVGVGLLADWQFGSLPWGVLVGTALGLALGILRSRMILKQLERQDRKDRLP